MMAAERGILKDVDPAELSLREYSGDDFWEGLDPDTQLLMSMGLAWEEHYAKQIAEDVAFHAGELHLDGIYLTPDGESLDTVWHDDTKLYLPAVHEIKLTSKSLNTVNGFQGDKNWLWRAQVKAYCKALGTNIAYVHVLFLYGDYARPFRPKLRIWRIEFSWVEIDMDWTAITSYVRYKEGLDREEEMRD